MVHIQPLFVGIGNHLQSAFKKLIQIEYAKKLKLTYI